MPVFEIEDGGQIYEVQAKDQDAAWAAYQDFNGPQKTPADHYAARAGVKADPNNPSYFDDVTKSGAAGLPQGVAGALGMPRMANDLVKAGMAGVSDFVGAPEFADRIRGAQGPMGFLPSRNEMVEGAKQPLGIEASQGKFYDPKTTPGRYAMAGAETLAQAPAMGGAAPAVAAGLAMEGGGDVAEYMGAPRWTGELGGAVLSGGRAAMKKPKQITPTSEDVLNVAGKRYKELDKIPVSQAYNNVIRKAVKKTLKDEKFHPQDHENLAKTLGRFEEYAPVNPKTDFMSRMTKVKPGAIQYKDMSMGDLNRVIKTLNKAKKAGGDEARIAYKLEDKIDGIVANMAGTNKIKAAKQAYFQGKKIEFLEDIGEQIYANSGNLKTAGLEQAIRTRFRQMHVQMTKKTPAGRQLSGMFTKEEKAMIRKMANPKFSFRSIMRDISAASNNPASRGMATVGLGGGAYLFEDPTLLALAGAYIVGGKVAGGLANRSAQKAFDKFQRKAAGIPEIPRSPLQVAQPAIRGAISLQGNE